MLLNGITQRLVAIKTIKNGVVTLKNGGKRSILHVSSLNFALKSSEEQQAIVFEYRNFLNSLNFEIQIFIMSRLVNIEPYMKSLEEAHKMQTNELLKIQTREYMNFINSFLKDNDIITTDFFIVVPLLEIEKEKEGSLENRNLLMQRVNYISSGLSRIGLRVRMLDTENIIALYWSIYNNNDMKKQSLFRSIFEN